MFSERQFDVVVYGATGFTGSLVAKYLAQRLVEGKEKFTFAIAGRNQKKLQEVRDQIAQINPELKELPILIGDSADQNSLERIARQTRALVTTAGPFTLYGLPVATACVKEGTHYVDSTGEVGYMKDLAERFHEEAKEKNLLVVPSCGVDCVPADIGALQVVEFAKKHKLKISEVEGFVKLRITPSGGTLNTMFTQFDQPAATQAALRHPFPYNFPFKVPAVTSFEKDRVLLGYSKKIGSWIAPSFLSTADNRVVRRSAALLGYGDDFHFNEVHEASSFFEAVIVNFLLALLLILAAIPFTRNFLRKIVSQPGTGPSEETLKKGYLKMRFVADTIPEGREPSKRIVSTVQAGTDVGYIMTSRMLAECVLLAAKQHKSPNPKGGVLTPAAAFGFPLRDRLNEVGLAFAVDFA